VTAELRFAGGQGTLASPPRVANTDRSSHFLFEQMWRISHSGGFAKGIFRQIATSGTRNFSRLIPEVIFHGDLRWISLSAPN
jgi:hypothetical protein